MLLTCLKCRKYTKIINQQVVLLVMVKQWWYQNVKYVIIENVNLLKNEKQKFVK